MIQVTELAYMGVGVKDLDAWKNFATSIVGFELADDGESDRCYLRMDYLHHRIVVHNDGTDDLAYLGFRALLLLPLRQVAREAIQKHRATKEAREQRQGEFPTAGKTRNRAIRRNRSRRSSGPNLV